MRQGLGARLPEYLGNREVAAAASHRAGRRGRRRPESIWDTVNGARCQALPSGRVASDSQSRTSPATRGEIFSRTCA